jgi:hypothetical protein
MRNLIALAADVSVLVLAVRGQSFVSESAHHSRRKPLTNWRSEKPLN